ncbi:MAG: glycerophosphodiester phosphodiesterase family protein [Bacteroidota bacterium]
MIKKIILVIIVLGLIAYYWFFKGVIQQKFISDEIENPERLKKVLNIAHRGASGYAPENTISAFIKALDFRPDMIELDIHMSSDGEAIVIHDATLERTTNGEGLVVEKTLSELKKLDAGSWYGGSFSGESIPELGEVLDRINGQSILLIEIKRGENGVYRGLGKKVVDIIDSRKARPWCIVQAFDSNYIKEVNKYAPGIKTQKLIVQNLDWLPLYVDVKFQTGAPDDDIEIEALNSYYKFLTRSRVDSRHNAGYETYVYTINDEPTMKKLINMGVDGIITNYPDRLLNLKLNQ